MAPNHVLEHADSASLAEDNHPRAGEGDHQVGGTVLAAGGMITVVVLIVSLVVPLEPPFRTNRAGSTIVESLTDRRELALATIVLWCLMGMAWLSFAAYVCVTFSQQRVRALLLTGCVGATLGGVFLAIGQFLIYGLPLSGLEPENAATVRTFVDVGSLVMGAGKWGVALFVLTAAIALYEVGALTRSFRTSGVVYSALFVIGSIGPNFARDGIFQFGDVVEVGTTVPATAWIFVLSWKLVRAAAHEGAATALGAAETKHHAPLAARHP